MRKDNNTPVCLSGKKAVPMQKATTFSLYIFFLHANIRTKKKNSNQ
jgi:hypothetical protein